MFQGASLKILTRDVSLILDKGGKMSNMRGNYSWAKWER